MSGPDTVLSFSLASCVALRPNLLYDAGSIIVVLAGLDCDAAPVVGECDRLVGCGRTHAVHTNEPPRPTIRRIQDIRGGRVRAQPACV